MTTFRSDVELVRVDAEVRTESGSVSDLRRDSFRVAGNGVEQRIVCFAHDEQPLDVILLFDTSNSMRRVVARVAEAAHMAIGELRPGDRVAIMANGPSRRRFCCAKPTAAVRFRQRSVARPASF